MLGSFYFWGILFIIDLFELALRLIVASFNNEFDFDVLLDQIIVFLDKQLIRNFD
jgi:hypothetical protein